MKYPPTATVGDTALLLERRLGGAVLGVVAPDLFWRRRFEVAGVEAPEPGAEPGDRLLKRVGEGWRGLGLSAKS